MIVAGGSVGELGIGHDPARIREAILQTNSPGRVVVQQVVDVLVVETGDAAFGNAPHRVRHDVVGDRDEIAGRRRRAAVAGADDDAAVARIVDRVVDDLDVAGAVPGYDPIAHHVVHDVVRHLAGLDLVDSVDEAAGLAGGADVVDDVADDRPEYGAGLVVHFHCGAARALCRRVRERGGVAAEIVHIVALERVVGAAAVEAKAPRRGLASAAVDVEAFDLDVVALVPPPRLVPGVSTSPPLL